MSRKHERKTPMWHSVEGHGTPPAIEDYPFQGLDVATEPYDTWHDDWFWLQQARNGAAVMRTLGPVPADISAGRYKRFGHRTPLGTKVEDLARREIGMPTAHGSGWDQSPDAWRDGDQAGEAW